MSQDAIDSLPPPELEQEIQACRDLVQGALRGTSSDAELAQLRGRVDDDLRAEQGVVGRLRSLRTTHKVLIILAVIALVTAFAVVTKPRSDLSAYPGVRMGVTLLVLSMVSGAATWRLLRPLHAPPPNVWMSRALLVLGVLTPVVLALFPIDHVGAPAGEGVAFAAACGKCLGYGGAFGLPVLILAFAVRRSRVDGAAVAALAGIAAGLTGNLTLQVHCPITDPSHLLVGHVMLLAILGGAAAVWKR